MPDRISPVDRPRVIVGGLALIGLAVYAIVRTLWPSPVTAVPSSPAAAEQHADSPAVAARTTAVKLAALQTAPVSPSQDLILEFDARIQSLVGKCSDMTATQIGDVAYVAWEHLKKAGKPLPLFQVVKGIDDSIPAEAAGIVKCTEVAAAWATMVSGN